MTSALTFRHPLRDRLFGGVPPCRPDRRRGGSPLRGAPARPAHRAAGHGSDAGSRGAAGGRRRTRNGTVCCDGHRVGSAAPQIVDYARRNTVDLVVLGTHGRTGVSRAVLGSVAEAVIRRARCRVLTVPATLPPAAVPPEDVEETTAFCAVCRAVSRDDLICETCRAKIRCEALERKLREERAGRR
jgi:hypothetical protein